MTLSKCERDAWYSDRINFPLPSAIISELRLGLESGVNFIEWLRTQKDLRLPVVVLATVVAKADKESLVRLDVDKVLLKPSDSTALREMLAVLAGELCSS